MAPKGGLDDVKYHLGAEGEVTTADGHTVRVALVPNPSHLEAVNPVVEGRTRAAQTNRSTPVASVDHATVVPVLLHGDAAFAAQGVVAETFNLSRLAGYATGGTIHLITNNQVGFTTSPAEGRSTDYSSDLAKGFDAPIIHVNADDPEACLAAARLAMMYRRRFGNDVVIDLVGYRRYGHNEGDEPGYSQPQMYAAIAAHHTVRELYRDELVAAGVVSPDDAAEDVKAVAKEMAAAQASLRKRDPNDELDRGAEALSREEAPEPVTAVAADRLRALNEQLLRWPEQLVVNAKLVKQLDRRRVALDSDEPQVEWAHAESLAFASLLADGTPIRLTGQDTVRGTFSQRHQAIIDEATGRPYVPIQHLEGVTAAFEVHDSPLSRVRVPRLRIRLRGRRPRGARAVGGAVRRLRQWRADHHRPVHHRRRGRSGARRRASSSSCPTATRVRAPSTRRRASNASWRSARRGTSGSATRRRRRSTSTSCGARRCTATAAAHRDDAEVAAPPPQAASRLVDLTDGAFASVLDDPRFARGKAAASVKRIVLCSGKVYYDLLLSAEREAAADLAIIRVERLYPFPTEDLRPILARYPSIEKLSWVQEEPRNMGARKFVMPKIRHLVPYKIPLGDVSRPERSRPAEGYPATHAAEQARIVHEALTS